MRAKISTVFVFFFIFITFSYTVEAQKKYLVVLDAGHGGKDSGNLGNGYRESNIALKVVLALGKELEKKKDVKVVYTRKKNVFIELHNRAKIANDNKADLFVSIHCDSHTSDAHGAGTFVLGLSGNSGNFEIAKRENAVILLEDDYKKNYDYDPNSPESVIGLSVLQEENLDQSLSIAGLIQANFSSIRRYDRKVKQANFLVLRETVMPSVLIELGFLTNKAEGRFLNTRTGQLRMGKAVARAIEKYLERLRLNEVSGKTKKEKIVIKEEKIKVKPKFIEKKKEDIATKVTKKIPDVKKVVKSIAKNKVIKSSKVEFKVQISASRRILPENAFRKLDSNKIDILFIDNYYKYYFENSSSYYLIKKALKKAREAGNKDAFVVAFKNGVKISLKEALKKQ